VISANVLRKDLQPAEPAPSDILISRDLLDKQIVDINGAKLVRVNDLRLGDVNGKMCMVAVDIGLRGILRRLNLEERGERFLSLFRYRLPNTLIGWHYLQPVEPKLSRLTLTISRQKASKLHPADLAEIISEVSQKERTVIFGTLDVETAPRPCMSWNPACRRHHRRHVKEKASDILEQMPPDEAADVLGDLPENKAKELIGLMEKEGRR